MRKRDRLNAEKDEFLQNDFMGLINYDKYIELGTKFGGKEQEFFKSCIKSFEREDGLELWFMNVIVNNTERRFVGRKIQIQKRIITKCGNELSKYTVLKKFKNIEELEKTLSEIENKTEKEIEIYLKMGVVMEDYIERIVKKIVELVKKERFRTRESIYRRVEEKISGFKHPDLTHPQAILLKKMATENGDGFEGGFKICELDGRFTRALLRKKLIENRHCNDGKFYYFITEKGKELILKIKPIKK